MCSHPVVAPAGSLCTFPAVEATVIGALYGNETFAPSLQAESVERKGLLFQGMRFHWAMYMTSRPTNLNQTSEVCTRAIFSVRLAIVKMEYDPAFGTPTYLPNLFSNTDNEMGDILWRGAALVETPSYCQPGLILPIQNSSTAGTMSRLGNHAPMERVKVKRRLDKNQAIFFVTNVHNPLAAATGGGNDAVLGLDVFGFYAARPYSK